MPIEIGSLVVRGTFGSGGTEDKDEARIEEALDDMRQEILTEVAEMIELAERRRQER
ncbi:MAG: DUF5908 family protein [Pseudomonadota bacterium]